MVSDPMQSAYEGVLLWAQAVRSANSDDVRAIRSAFRGQRLDEARGPVEIDAVTQHTLQTARVGQFNKDGRLEEVYLSPKPVVPEPFPGSRSRAAWESFLDSLYRGWGDRWSNPGT
jgi:urea transport system substrate-binding protein